VRRWHAAYIAAALLVLLWHYRLALPGRALVANDFRALFIALRMGLQNTVRAGDWPFWQRGMFFGYPLIGDIQFQLWNPLTWLTLPMNAARGITVQTLLELCLCSIGMAYWMKQRGLRAAEGVFAGVAFALCLKQTVHLHHWTFASTTCAWPGMFAGVDGWHAEKRARFLWLTALATAGSWIGASPQMAYFGTGLAFVYALSLRSWPAAAALGLGALLTSPMLFPVLELNDWGPRGAGITYKFAASWSWPDRGVWVSMLLPRAWGGRGDFRGPMNYWELQGYFGLLPMALACVAPRRRRRNWLFLAAVALCLWISFGNNGWLGLHRFAWRFLPGYGSFRNPTRALMPAAFCMALLAAEGLARLREQPQLRLRALGAMGVLAFAVALCALSPQGYWVAALRNDAAWALALLAAGAAWAFFARPDPRWALLAVPMFLADVAVQCWDSPEVGEAAREGHALEALEPAMPPAPEPRRVAALLDWGEDNNATFARGWEGVTGYGPNPIDRVLRLFDATWSGVIKPPRPLDDDENFKRFRADSPLTPLFGAPLLAANRDASALPVARAGDVRLYRMPALPRVFWTGAWRALPDEQSGRALQAAATGALAVLSQPIALQPAQAAQPQPASSIEVRTNSLSAALQAPADGLAVVLDPWYPGWSATVDGQPAEIARADYAFMAVPVRAGPHRIELRYFPRRLLPGLAVAIAALALLILLVRRVDTPGSRG